MAADPIVICLQNLTDYNQFERLCHDLMALQGYTKIEPLGGSQDKGRDAVHSDSSTQQATVFAYSVREDWRVKLREDAKRIKKHGHPCHTLVFLCTSEFTSTERDEAVAEVKRDFGWDLELYGVERFRTLLVGPHVRLISQHPQIFTPTLVRPIVSPDAPRTVLIVDHHADDSPFAVWLGRKLTILGYDVWCRGVSPTGGAPWADQVENLLGTTAFRLLAIISPSGAADSDLTFRRGLAAATTILLPILASEVQKSALDSKTQGSEFVDFTKGWAAGLVSLTKNLEKFSCPKEVGALPNSFFESLSPPDILGSEPEIICSNRFRITAVPGWVRRLVTDKEVSLEDFKEFRTKWACRRVDPNRFLSFSAPPADLQEKYVFRPVPGVSWENMSEIDGIPVRSVVPELIRKSVEVHYSRLGLKYCENRHLLYYSEGLFQSDRLPVTKLDGSKTAIGCVGQRKYWTPKLSTNYKYFLAPVFSVHRVGESYMLIVRPRVRLTDEGGVPLVGRMVNSRRKHLCKNWWNDDWLHRILGVVQFGAVNGVISIGSDDAERLTIDATPEMWSVTPSINDEALNRNEEDREEALAYLTEEDEELEEGSETADTVTVQ